MENGIGKNHCSFNVAISIGYTEKHQIKSSFDPESSILLEVLGPASGEDLPKSP